MSTICFENKHSYTGQLLYLKLAFFTLGSRPDARFNKRGRPNKRGGGGGGSN